ncbi:MAG: thermonuclease family protein [Alphaproteobacteria bacterium]
MSARRPLRNPLAALILLVLPVSAGTAAAEPLVAAGTGRAVEIVDGDTLVLEDGRSVRLVGIQAPKLPLGRAGFKAWPLGETAKAALAELTMGRVLTLSHGGARRDRYGRVLAHLRDADGRWIQGDMLARGLARVYSFADNRALMAEMLAREGAARAAGRGIWAHPFYAVRAAGAAGRHIGGFELVEGRVLAAARVRARVYLNFGPDWRTDFTVSLDAGARRLFAKAGVDPLSLEGKRIRVRGWIRSYNGPMIEATHPEQIEVLEP